MKQKPAYIGLSICGIIEKSRNVIGLLHDVSVVAATPASPQR
jgi:hypothetical protein